MPTYQYACTACEHRFDAVQSFSAPSLTDCPACAGRLRKVFSSVGIVFKGSGFYRTDSRAKDGAATDGQAKDGAAAKDGAKASPGGEKSSASAGSAAAAAAKKEPHPRAVAPPPPRAPRPPPDPDAEPLRPPAPQPFPGSVVHRAPRLSTGCREPVPDRPATSYRR